MNSKSLIVFLFFILLSTQSCQFFSNKNNKLNYDCDEIFNELNHRYSLFAELSKNEIKNRQNIEVDTVSSLDKLSVFSKIIEAIKNAPINAKFIAVDLRNYKKVNLGNIIIANINPKLIATYLKTSKYSQGYFALVNLNKKSIKYFPQQVNKVFESGEINRNDLSESEIVINVSDSELISGNMKFPSNQIISIIADNIKKPFRLDLRESSNMQFNLDKKWVMAIYSFENSFLKDGKITTGFFKFINNKNSRINIQKFTRSNSKCYIDKIGNKLK